MRNGKVKTTSKQLARRMQVWETRRAQAELESFKEETIARTRSIGDGDVSTHDAIRIFSTGTKIMEIIEGYPDLTSAQRKEKATEILMEIIEQSPLKSVFGRDDVDDMIETVIQLTKGAYVINQTVKKCKLLCC